MRAPLLAFASGLLAACATSQATSTREHLACLTPTSELRPASQVGRIAVGDGTWTEVVVTSTAASASKTCQLLLAHEVDLLARSGLTARVEQACGAAPPHGLALAPGTRLLVSRRAVTAADLLLLAAAEGGIVPEETTHAAITQVAGFGTDAECERARSTLAEAERRDRAEATASAHAWLERQIEEETARAKKACLEAADVKARCAKLPSADDVARACEGGKKKACEEARKKALDRQACDLELEHADRGCKGAEAIVDAMKQRSEAGVPADTSAEAPRCVDPSPCSP